MNTWEIGKRIEFLQWLHKCDPGDYMVEFELLELYERVKEAEQPSNVYTLRDF